MASQFYRTPRRLLALCLLLTGGWIERSAANITWLDPLEVATGQGQRGEWRQNDSDYDHVDDGTVAIDAAGNIAVAWVDQGRKDVRFQVFAPDGAKRFAEPVNVSRTPAVFSWLPRIVMASDDVFVLWQEIVFSGGSHGGEMFFARSRTGGSFFEAPLNLSHSVAGDGKGRIDREHWDNGSFDLLLSPRGLLFAAWTEYDGVLWLARSTDRGARFSRPLRIAGSDTAPARAPSLAASDDGAVYLAWTLGEDAAADIRVARSDDAGQTFRAPVNVYPSSNYSDAPKIAVDGRGALHLVYAESEAGPFARFRVRHTHSTDRGQTFPAPRDVSEPQPEGSVSASFPSLATIDGDTLFVAWELFPRPSDRPRGLGFARSDDGGTTFSRPIVIPGSVDPAGGHNGSYQGLLMRKLAANRSGAIAVTNSSLEPGHHSRVWLLRGQSTRPQETSSDAQR